MVKQTIISTFRVISDSQSIIISSSSSSRIVVVPITLCLVE